jgi:chromosomal replication initiator protein
MNPPSAESAWGDFLALPENLSALRAVRAVARSLTTGKRPRVTPLVLHGSPGTGKTHLTSALLRAVARGPEVVTARSVAVGDAARLGAGDDRSFGFADRDFLTCDLLVLEGAQHLPEKAADAVCDLLDRRAGRRRAVVVTAGAGPSELAHLPQRLTSRLAAGLVVRTDPLSAASRRAVLKAAAAGKTIRLTDAALDWLAARTGGLRGLLGLLQNIAQLAPAFPGPLDRPDVERVVAETGQPTSAGGDLSAILKRVAAAFGVSERDVLGPGRTRNVMVPRQVAMYVARAVAGLSLPRIGAFFGRDHTTVLHAVRKVAGDMQADAALDGRVRRLLREAA